MTLPPRPSSPPKIRDFRPHPSAIHRQDGHWRARPSRRHRTGVLRLLGTARRRGCQFVTTTSRRVEFGAQGWGPRGGARGRGQCQLFVLDRAARTIPRVSRAIRSDRRPPSGMIAAAPRPCLAWRGRRQSFHRRHRAACIEGRCPIPAPVSAVPCTLNCLHVDPAMGHCLFLFSSVFRAVLVVARSIRRAR